MKNKIIILLWIFFGIGSLNAQIMLEETKVDTTTIISGLDIPWELLYGPDDHLWITERFGRLSRVHPASGEQTIVLDLSGSIYVNGEAGLLGMALHPDFIDQPYVFLAYTYLAGDDILKRIVRYTYADEELQLPIILLDSIPAKNNHNGCRLIITPDEKLLITNGDAGSGSKCQNMAYLNGKTLRINLDGNIPGDNPWENLSIYTLGHRNPQGLCMGPNGIIYSSEHGPDTDDELNIIEAGSNYGWPEVWGYCDMPDEMDFCEEYEVNEPITTWTPTVATSDIIYYNHPAIPEWKGSILMTTLKDKRLRVLQLDDTGTEVVQEHDYFDDLWGRLRDVCQGPDGSVYLATNGPDWNNSEPFTHRIVRVWNPAYTVGLNENFSNNSEIRVYPNPATDRLFVSLPMDEDKQRFQLISSTGGVVIDRIIDTRTFTVDTSGLEGGLYLVTVGQPGNIIYREKVMVLD